MVSTWINNNLWLPSLTTNKYFFPNFKPLHFLSFILYIDHITSTVVSIRWLYLVQQCPLQSVVANCISNLLVSNSYFRVVPFDMMVKILNFLRNRPFLIYHFVRSVFWNLKLHFHVDNSLQVYMGLISLAQNSAETVSFHKISVKCQYFTHCLICCVLSGSRKAPNSLLVKALPMSA